MEKLKQLQNYYKDKETLLIGMNDSQGVNVNSTFWKKGLLDYIADAIKTEGLSNEVINAFSLTMNKTEHIDYFLKNNLSIEEIKLSQIYSTISALEKLMTDLGLPKKLGTIGNVSKLLYKPTSGDKEKRISTLLKNTEEPIMIYSSGVNNLMREVGSNPFAIKNDYKQRNKKPNYYYTLAKTENPRTLKKVINSIERNYENILDINPKTDIYTLGAYIPKALTKEELKIFKELVLKYNEELERISKEYQITFIDTEEVGKKYNQSSNNFHISSAGHNALANYILHCMYENKIKNQKQPSKKRTSIYEISNKGVQGVIDSISLECNKSLEKSKKTTGYSRKRELAILKEHEREKEIFQKVLTKTI